LEIFLKILPEEHYLDYEILSEKFVFTITKDFSGLGLA